ncbi:MAG: M20/M25/M40 family metallo-hydrolase, partial [Pseudomonadota bacterium]
MTDASNLSEQFSWLDRLVRHDTTSSKSNLALIDDVDAYLRAQGAETWRVESYCGGKANLYARVGPAAAGGVVLSGHTDVVPVEGQDWKTDPFVVQEKDGRLYGRGTSDMKAFSAIGLSLVPKMTAA